MEIEIGKTYMVKDGAGFTAMMVNGLLSGFAYGSYAVDTDGEDVLTFQRVSIPLSSFIEPIEGVNWDKAVEVPS